MGQTGSQRKTIALSLVVAVILIGGAYVLAGNHLPSFTLNSANAESTSDLLKAYSTKDSDGDGLPDWEEALYGTDPNNPHSVRPNLTDAQAVAQGLVASRYSAPAPAATSTADIASEIPGPVAAPDSLTNQFAKLFFNNYISSRGNTVPTADQIQSFVGSTISQLEQTKVRTDAFTASDVRISGTGSAALLAYAASVDKVFAARNPHTPYSEITYLSDAVQKSDDSALKSIRLISAAYLGTANDLKALPVPKEAGAAHLAFMNALAQLGNTIADLASLQNDPIRAMLGLQEYASDVNALNAALSQMSSVFTSDNVTIAVGEPGWSFFHLISVPSTASSTAPTP